MVAATTAALTFQATHHAAHDAVVPGRRVALPVRRAHADRARRGERARGRPRHVGHGGARGSGGPARRSRSLEVLGAPSRTRRLVAAAQAGLVAVAAGSSAPRQALALAVLVVQFQALQVINGGRPPAGRRAVDPGPRCSSSRCRSSSACSPPSTSPTRARAHPARRPLTGCREVLASTERVFRVVNVRSAIRRPHHPRPHPRRGDRALRSGRVPRRPAGRRGGRRREPRRWSSTTSAPRTRLRGRVRRVRAAHHPGREGRGDDAVVAHADRRRDRRRRAEYAPLFGYVVRVPPRGRGGRGGVRRGDGRRRASRTSRRPSRAAPSGPSTDPRRPRALPHRDERRHAADRAARGRGGPRRLADRRPGRAPSGDLADRAPARPRDHDDGLLTVERPARRVPRGHRWPCLGDTVDPRAARSAPT